MLTEKELEERGFTSYPPCDFTPADKCYQKCFRSNKGDKKYFLDAYHYTLIHPTTKEDLGGWELNTQLYLAGTHAAFNMVFLEDDIDAAVDLIEFLFANGKLDNYEDRD